MIARRLSQAMVVSAEEMASAFRSELHSSLRSLFSFPSRAGGLDRADSSSAFNWRHNWSAHLAKQGN